MWRSRAAVHFLCTLTGGGRLAGPFCWQLKPTLAARNAEATSSGRKEKKNERSKDEFQSPSLVTTPGAQRSAMGVLYRRGGGSREEEAEVVFSVVISVSKLPYRMHKFLAERATDALFCLCFRRGSFSFHCAPIICDRKRPRWRGWSGSWRRMRGGEQYPSVPPGERNKGDDSAVRDSKQTSSLGLLGLWRRGLLAAFLHQPSPFFSSDFFFLNLFILSFL